MQSGNLKPFISQEAVRSALDAFLYASKSPDTANSLASLVLVDEFLTDPDFPPTSIARAIATQRLLSSIVIENFMIIRRNLGISLLEDITSRPTALVDLAHIAGYNNPDLSSWATLYYRYIRVDLSISSELLADVLSVDERTLRRYLTHGVRRLTERLVEAEWSARTRHHKRRLLSQLPSHLSTPLFGRQQEFSHIQTILLGQPPLHLQITGAAGIGKSALVQQVVFERIQTHHVDRIVWLCAPPSIEFVRQYLIEMLMLDGSSIDLRKYLQVCRTILIIDDIAISTSDDLPALESLLGDLTYAEVYLISRHFLTLGNLKSNLHLPELTFNETVQLAQAVVAQDTFNEKLSEDEIQKLWGKVGGNPQAIKLAACKLAFGIENYSETVYSLYGEIYDQLSDKLRSAWFRCAILLPDQIDTPAQVQQAVDYSLVAEADLYSLRQQHLLEMSDVKPRTFHLTTSARQFLISKYRSCATAHQIVEEIICQLEQLIYSEPLRVLYIAENILLHGWPPLEHSRQTQWITTLVEHGLHQGRYVHWSEILGRYHTSSTEFSPMVDVTYGICLRRLCDWRKSRRLLEDTIAECGRRGLFVEQAKALLELAVLCRYQGNYQRAVVLLRKAEKAAARLQEERLMEALRVERAQIAVDRGDALGARAHVSDLNLDNARILLIYSDIYRLTGDYVACRDWAARALQVSSADKSAMSHIHTTIARSYEGQQRWQDARYHFESALHLLEQDTSNLFAIGRARLNLGAVLIREKRYKDASNILKDAEAIQSKLRDRVGLSATRHNLRLLKTLALG